MTRLQSICWENLTLFLLIFYKKYKTEVWYNLIKAVVILYAICSTALLVSVSSNNEKSNEDKIAITASFFMAFQGVVGDSILWLVNFPKLK